MKIWKQICKKCMIRSEVLLNTFQMLQIWRKSEIGAQRYELRSRKQWSDFNLEKEAQNCKISAKYLHHWKIQISTFPTIFRLKNFTSVSQSYEKMKKRPINRHLGANKNQRRLNWSKNSGTRGLNLVIHMTVDQVQYNKFGFLNNGLPIQTIQKLLQENADETNDIVGILKQALNIYKLPTNEVQVRCPPM